MKITAFVVILCISVLAWYNYPDPASTVVEQPAPPIAAPESPQATTEYERVATTHNKCESYEWSREWQDLKKIYPDMSAAELCDFVLVPTTAKIDGQTIDLDAARAFLSRILNDNVENDDYMAEVPDLRYYLDPQAIEAMRGLTRAQLVDKINNERSAEAAYWLAHQYLDDEQTYVMLMLNAASYAQKPGPLLNAINGCCAYTPGDALSKREADIKREALIMIAREMNLPDANDWPEFELDPDIEAEVLAQRAAYVDELNQYSMQAFGEEWVK